MILACHTICPQAARANAALAAKGAGASAAATPGAAGGRPAWELAVDGWDRVYGLDINYLLVARVRRFDQARHSVCDCLCLPRQRLSSRACYLQDPLKT